MREVWMSGTGSTVISACLMVSLAISGRSKAGAIARARVVFPLAGGPETTTNVHGGSWLPMQPSWQPGRRRARQLGRHSRAVILRPLLATALAAVLTAAPPHSMGV